MATTNLSSTQYLQHLVSNAWQGDTRRVYHLAEQAADAGEITVAEAKELRQLASAMHTLRPASTMYKRHMLKLQGWAAKYGA